MFDEYVSLGGKCETAFQFRRVLGRDSSSFFSWNVTPLKSLIRLLETRFEGILQPENLEPNEWLVWDKFANFAFHLQGEGRKSKSHPNFAADLERFAVKAQYLIGKLYDNARSEKKIAYFFRSDENYDILPDAVQVRDLLEELHGSRNFTLVFIQAAQKSAPDWQIESVYNRYIKRLAPESDQSDAHLQSWDQIFREFPHAQGLRLCDWLD